MQSGNKHADELKTRRIAFTEGVVGAWPICLGYMPIGLAFGILAQKAGLEPFEIAVMSVIVFAGSSQFIAVSMLAAGAGAAAIIFTTFVVNLRHFLMSMSLSVFMGKANRLKLSLFSYGITDESFAINYSRFKRGGWDVNRAIILNQTANFTWIISTVLGGYGGRFIGDRAFGLDYALIAMFICLLVFQLRGQIYVITAIIAGVSAVVLSIIIPGNSYIVIASVLAATISVIFKKIGRGKDGES